jgi:hypothetical protein
MHPDAREVVDRVKRIGRWADADMRLTALEEIGAIVAREIERAMPEAELVRGAKARGGRIHDPR